MQVKTATEENSNRLLLVFSNIARYNVKVRLGLNFL